MSSDSALALSIREHNISYVIPKGAEINGTANIKGGALIMGQFVGRLVCDELIIAQGAVVAGEFTVGRAVYVAGLVTGVKSGGATRPSSINCRTGVVCLMAGSRVRADIEAVEVNQDPQAQYEGTIRNLSTDLIAARTLPPMDGSQRD